jgi:hypothetical protein
VNVPPVCVKIVEELCEPPMLKLPVGAVKSPCNSVNLVNDRAVVPPLGVKDPAGLSTIKCAVRGRSRVHSVCLCTCSVGC